MRAFTQQIQKKFPVIITALNSYAGKKLHCETMQSDTPLILKKKETEKINKISLENLISQSRVFCSSPLLEEVLGLKQITKTTNPKEFFEQILSRELGAMIKTKTRYFGEEQQEKIIKDIFTDIKQFVEKDPVEPTPFQVAVTFNGFKALATHRIAYQLWQNGRTEDALILSSAAHSNYHVNIHPSAQIEAGVLIDHAFGVTIKKNTKIGSGTYILHNTRIGENVIIGKNVLLGAGAKIASNVKIGNNAIIGAGTHVIADVPNDSIAFGVYANYGSSKITLAPRFFKLPDEMQKFSQKISEQCRGKQDTKTDNTVIINKIINLIPFNPNSHLTIKNLEEFHNKVITNQQLLDDDKTIILSVYKIANAAWQESLSDSYSEDEKMSYKNFALWLQGRIATVFKVDIHPAAQIHESAIFPKEVNQGIVIGETAQIGKNSNISDGVTLGSNGKDRGDRHPKIGANCYIGKSSIILGGGRLGDNSVIMPNSVLSIPKNSKTPEGRVYAGKPAIDITPTCKANEDCKIFLNRLEKYKNSVEN